MGTRCSWRPLCAHTKRLLAKQQVLVRISWTSGRWAAFMQLLYLFAADVQLMLAARSWQHCGAN